MKKLKIIFILFLWPALLLAQTPFGNLTLTTESNNGDLLIVVQGDTTVRMTIQTLLGFFQAQDIDSLKFKETSAPSAPATGFGLMYLNSSDGHVYLKTSSATFDLTEGTGGGGADSTYTETDTINNKTPGAGVLVEDVFHNDGNLVLKSGNRLYLDGGTDTWIDEGSNIIDFFVNNGVKLRIWEDRIHIMQSLWPFASGTLSLGTNSYWWADSYVSDYYVGNTSTGINKDPSGNLTLYDAVTGSKTLAELATGSGSSVEDTIVIPLIIAWPFADSASMTSGRDFAPVEWGGSTDTAGIDSIRVLCITGDTPNFSFNAYANDTLNTTTTTAETIFSSSQTVGAASATVGQTFIPNDKAYLLPNEKMWIRIDDRTLLPRYGATIQAYVTVY